MLFRFKIFCFLSFFSFSLFSQVKYYDASQFPLIGKISNDTETRYERLPTYLKNKSRTAVWNLGKNTAGLAIRFKTNSTSISAKWEVLNDLYMNHMAATGIKGLDLYAWENSKWSFVKSARPSNKSNEELIIENMKSADREFMLFLPLYDGIISLMIGIDSTATISSPSLPYPAINSPIVVYGTSITQGGCASRPGMCYTNILTRQLNTEFINLGFSGNGKLDSEIAEIMAQKRNVKMFILDFVANNTAQEVREKTLPFIEIIRKNSPKTPILLIENSKSPYSLFDDEKKKSIRDKNRALKNCFELQRKRDKNIHYLCSDNLIGYDNEGTVDGSHFTDLGYSRFAEILSKKIEKILSE